MNEIQHSPCYLVSRSTGVITYSQALASASLQLMSRQRAVYTV